MTYTSTILADHPIAYYRLDEVSGSTAFDLSGNGYNATLSSGVTFGQRAAIPGESDASILFGGNDVLSLPATLNLSTWSALSLEFWINLTSGWQHIVVTSSGGTPLLYLNGQVYSSGGGDSVLLDQGLLYAGSLSGGYLDEVALYSFVLSPTQINHHFLVGTTLLPSFPPLTISPSPLGFIGEGILPVTPTVPYTINGTLLDTQPFLTTAPMTVANRLLSRGSVFFLLFSSPSFAVQALITNGTTVTMRFTLVDGTVITGPVQLATTTAGTQWLVMCTTTADISTITPHILTQFA